MRNHAFVHRYFSAQPSVSCPKRARSAVPKAPRRSRARRGATATEGSEQFGIVPDKKLITEAQNAMEVAIYPNPTSDVLHLRVLSGTVDETVQVCVRDVQGNLLIKQHAKAVFSTFDISTFPEGIYILEVSSSDQVCYQRFVVASR